MAFPLFTLSTKPDHTTRRYEQGDHWIEIAPSPEGRATVHDRDVLIYCISQCMAAINRGEKIYKTMSIHAHDLLRVTNRQTSGVGYKALHAALKRLQGTQIQTNITTGGQEQWDVFSFIDKAKTIRETRDGRMVELQITLSDWIFNAIRAKSGEILTIHKDYFRLRKPLERRLYELARKHCGTKNREWKFTLRTLYERTGSASTFREFKRMINTILDANSEHHHIPDYKFSMERETVVIRPRESLSVRFLPDGSLPNISLRLETYEKAQSLAKGYDVYAIEADWRDFLMRKKTPPKSADRAFLGFVKKWVQNHS